MVQFHLLPFRNLAISFTPHLPVAFGRNTKSRWSLLSGVYARGSKRSHTGGKFVTCSGVTNSRQKDNSCVSPSLGYLEVNHLRPSVSTTAYLGTYLEGETSRMGEGRMGMREGRTGGKDSVYMGSRRKKG